MRGSRFVAALRSAALQRHTQHCTTFAYTVYNSLVVLGTGSGTCEKVLVAKTKSFSAVIDTLWHLYSETLSVWTTGFYVLVSPFGTIWRICIL